MYDGIQSCIKCDNTLQKFWTRKRKGRNILNLLSDTVIVQVVTDIVSLLLEARNNFLHIQDMMSRRKQKRRRSRVKHWVYLLINSSVTSIRILS